MVQISIDQNAVQITLHKLNGMNYLPCSQLMKLIVQGWRKIGYLTGLTKATIENDPTNPKWEAKNSSIMSWLINSMETNIWQLYLFFPTTKDKWDTYSNLGNSTQLFELKPKLR